jgi:hypothetical protein
VAAPKEARITFDSDSAKRRFSDGRLLTIYLNPPKNTPSIAEGLGGDEFGIVGVSPTIN